ncbi:beta-lactamase family protein [Pelagibacteraceae bacterium]|nr:beta-lactamase family protein [Pelagibacteraceae bacterium]
MIEKELNSLFETLISKNYFQGIQWSIQKNNSNYNGKVGYMDLDKKDPIRNDTIYRIWSMTKPIIAFATMILLEKKKISLDDQIEKYLPEAKKLKVLKIINNQINLENLKRSITIKDLLLHTAGFSYNFLNDPIGQEYEKEKIFHSEQLLLKDEVSKILSLPLLFQPGEKWNYSVSIDILAHIIEVITNQSIFNFLDQNIFKPLKMNDTFFFVDKNNRNRIMTSYEFVQKSNTLNKVLYKPQSINNYGYPNGNIQYARGGHGLFTTIDNYMKFAQMLLTGKNVNNDILLSENYLKLINKNYLDYNLFPLEITSIGENKYDNIPNDLIPYGWGLGFRVMIDKEKNANLGSNGEFGWSGAAATYFLVDPSKNLTAVLMTQVLQANPILKKLFYEFIYTKFK